MRFEVIEPWRATYPDPIRMRAGDPVTLTGRRDVWDGHVWLWAVASSGLEGWIPDAIVREGPSGVFAKEDYSAEELTCEVGQALAGEHETHGWVFCRSADGAAGWVPRRNLKRTDA